MVTRFPLERLFAFTEFTGDDMAMTLISSQVLSTSAASVTFSSIPQTFKSLRLVVSARGTDTGLARNDLSIKFNGSSTSYSGSVIRGYDSNLVGSTTSSTTFFDMDRTPAGLATANVFGNAEITIPNYSEASNKAASVDAVAENNSSTSWYVSLSAGLWSNTAAITSITFAPSAGSWATGSSFYLYGIK